MNAPVGVTGFFFDGGTLNGSGALTVNSLGRWTAGTLDGSGGGRLVVVGGAQYKASAVWGIYPSRPPAAVEALIGGRG